MRRALLFLSLVSCAASRPDWVAGSATTWTIPLLDPKTNTDGPLFVNVTIEGQGPYVFLFDPDGATVIDRALAERLDLLYGSWGSLIDSRDQPVRVRGYQADDLRAGDFHLPHVSFLGVEPGSLVVDGTHVFGVLGQGGPVISSTMIVDVDRAAGAIKIAYAGHQHIPAGAIAVKGRSYGNTLVVQALLDGKKEVGLMVDLRASHSQIWDVIAQPLGVGFGPPMAVLDELGTTRQVGGPSATPIPVTLAGMAPQPIAFAQYDDKRTTDVYIGGVLGQDYLSRFHPVIDVDHQTLWLAPR